MSRVISKIKQQFVESLKPSIKSALWLLRMMLPIMLGVSLLDYFGVIEWISVYTTPMFNMLGLDGRAAFVYITSVLASIYSAIGVMTLFDFGLREVTIMASMCLIAHNLIIEGAIQSRSGVSMWGITLLRIVSSMVCGYFLNLILPSEMAGSLYLDMADGKVESLGALLSTWLTTSLKLALKVILIIYLLNVLQNILKAFNVLNLLIASIYPLLAVMGLPRSTSFLWMVANTLGLAYGGAIIVGEYSKGEISRSDASLLNISLAQTHSLLEDTVLFVSLGVGLFWVVVPRLLLSIITVWAHRGINALKVNHFFVSLPSYKKS
ncbi:MAG: nucleoside recognition domain-containing protein [Rikenellaceae bacterium]